MCARNGAECSAERARFPGPRVLPFVQKITWASNIDSDGRPVLNPDQVPSEKGTRTCPSVIGATNWWLAAFNPATGLCYFRTLENCSIYSKRDTEWESGRSYITWELPQQGAGASRSGTLSTATGLLFFCDDAAAFVAANAVTGNPVWQFQVNRIWRASPMTDRFDNKQYAVVAFGATTIISFGL